MQIEKRVKEQIEWNESNSSRNKNCYIIFSVFILVGSIVTATLVNTCPCFVQIVSLFVAISTGLLNFYNFKEKWIIYRMTAERLKKEEDLFDNNCGEYKDKSLDVYTINIERILDESNQLWVESFKKTEKQQSN